MAAETFRIEIPVRVDDQTEPGVGSATRKMNGFDRTVQQTQERLDRMNRTRYEVAVEALDKASSVIGRIGTSLKGIAGKAWRITMNVLDKATAPIRGVINLLKNPILQAGAILGISVGLKDTIDTYATFEATMSKVKAVSGATAEQMELLTTKAKEMGSTTKFTASEAGEAFTYMAMAGWDAQQMMDGISGIMALSAADGLDLATTSDIVTDALTAFGLQAKDSGHFADVLAKASSSANTNVEMLGESFKYVAPIAGAMKYSVEDVSLALGLMANASVKGSMAGTSLKTALANMSAPTDQMAAVMDKYGITLTDANGNMKSLKEVLDTVRLKMGKLSETEKTAAASTLFGKEAMSGMLAIINASDEDYQKLAESIANADGAAQQMSDTMLDNLSGSFTLLQSAAEGVKITVGERLKPHLQRFVTWLTGKMPAIEKAAGEVMDFVDEKIAWLSETVNEFMSGEDWENADIWGKIKIAWDKIVAEPFSQWWNSTGKAWFAEKAESIGKGIGSGITAGLLALLGIDIKGAAADGKSVGSSFIQGFKEGFDTEKIGEALKTWASNNKEIVVGLGVILGGKLIAGIAKGVRQGKNLYNDLKSILGKGSNSSTPGTGGGMVPSTYTTTTMTVTASVVNVYGNTLNNGRNMPSTGGSGGGSPLLLPGSGMAGRALLGGGGGAPALPGGGAPLGLPGGTGGAAAAAGGLTSATGWLGKLLQFGSSSSVIGADGTLLSVSGGIGGTLGSVAGSLGSGATTAAGAAAVGGGSILGAIGGLLGIGSGIWDFFKGSQKEGKEAKDEYFSGGTKIGMVGAGAGIGAGIGALFGGVGAAPGALIGAGIGGIASLFTGSDIGKWLSDATDEGGWLNNTGKAISKFFTTTLPEKWNSFWGGVGDFFTSTVPEWWGNLTDAVGSFFTETIPEKWGEFWEGVGNFFTETIPYAIGYAAGKIEVFFTEDIPEFFGNLWDGISTFFTSTLPTWASDVWNNKIVPFFTESIPTFFGNLWDSISTFFTSTLPTWASDVWNNKIVPFFTESIPTFFGNLWDGITTFFTSTLPTWASDTWNGHIVPFFTETIPGFFGDLWDSITGFFTETLPNLASSIWGSIKSFFTETIPSFFGSLWDTVKGWFGAGYSDAKSGAGYGASQHAYGGIMTKPHMGIVAEDGPESIIPLEPGKRARGIDLWEETGRNLGVLPYADGGIVGDTDEATTAEAIPLTSGGAGSTGAPNIFEIEVKVNPEFVIQSNEGMDEESIVAIIKARIKEMVDDIGDELAERLARIFANTPVKGGA